MSISRKDATGLGCIRYDISEPCKTCHGTVRYTKSAKCVACSQKKGRKHFARNSGKVLAKQKIDRDADLEERREAKMRWKLKADARIFYARNRACKIINSSVDLDEEITKLEDCLDGTLPICGEKDIHVLINLLTEEKSRRKQEEAFEVVEPVEAESKERDTLPCHDHFVMVPVCQFCNREFTRFKWYTKHTCLKKRRFDKIVERLMQQPRDF